MALLVQAKKDAALIEFINSESNNHVVFNSAQTVDTFETKYMAMCVICNQVLKWQHNYDEEFGVDLKWLGDFCQDHKHEKVTFIKKDASGEWKEAVLKIKPGQVVQINDKTYHVTESKTSELIVPVEVPKESGQEIPMLGTFDFHPGGRPVNTVSVSQTLLKEIAKLSNFNVDLQAKVLKNIATSYRAICTECNRDCQIVFEELIASDRKNPTWERLKEFCEIHSHIKKVETVEGRKFRYEPSGSPS